MKPLCTQWHNSIIAKTIAPSVLQIYGLITYGQTFLKQLVRGAGLEKKELNKCVPALRNLQNFCNTVLLIRRRKLQVKNKMKLRSNALKKCDIQLCHFLWIHLSQVAASLKMCDLKEPAPHRRNQSSRASQDFTASFTPRFITDPFK